MVTSQHIPVTHTSIKHVTSHAWRWIMLLSLLRYSFFTTWPSFIPRSSLSARLAEASWVTGMKLPTTCSRSPACSCCLWSSWSPVTPGSSVRSPNAWKRTTVSLNPGWCLVDRFTLIGYHLQLISFWGYEPIFWAFQCRQWITGTKL